MNGKKLALGIRLIGESKLEISFLHWDERFLSDEKNEKFVYFESGDSEFCIYSHSDGYIIDDGQFALIVPDVDNMKAGSILTHEFRNDGVRHDFLKTMHEYLPEWANRWEKFENDQETTHDFVVHQQYWVY